MWGSRDPLLKFWDPLISRERLELETLNLVRRRTSVTAKEKNAKMGQKGSCGATLPIFGILGPPDISRTVEASNFKFGTETEGSEF